MWCATKPEGIETQGPCTCCTLNACDALLVRFALLLWRHGILRSPRLSMTRGFVPALNDLCGQGRGKIDGCTYHVGGNCDVSPVEHVQQSRKPFFESVFVPLNRRQIGIHWIKFRHWACRST